MGVELTVNVVIPLPQSDVHCPPADPAKPQAQRALTVCSPVRLQAADEVSV